MMGGKYWIDENTGRVHRVYEYQEDPETVRLNKKRSEKAKAKRMAAKKARRRNRKRR